MNRFPTRRSFLAEVGQGMLITALGVEVAADLGLARAAAADAEPSLDFGALEPLVRLMQETPVERLLGKLAQEIRSGTDVRRLVAAGALANARTFGGEDYIGYHTFMALAPAYQMSRELPSDQAALPVLKVLYRNTGRIQERGGRKEEVLHPVPAVDLAPGAVEQEHLRDAVRRQDFASAERIFAALSRADPDAAFNQLLHAVQDQTEVHRVVLPYRAWELADVVGREHAHTLLRQSVRYCLKAESWNRAPRPDDPRTLLPKLLEEYRLLGRSPGHRAAEDGWVETLGDTIFQSTPAQAAAAVAGALAEGFAPSAIGEAVALAANQLLLRDQGRLPAHEVAGKPVGSVHGDSIGVHACDSANAWRNTARVADVRNGHASLILGAYQVALDRTGRGGDFLHWTPLPIQRHLTEVKSTDVDGLLREADEAIRGNLQAKASAVVHRYGELGHPPRPVLDLMLRYAVSEDGSLHAEKFYRTASEEFAAARPAFRWRHLVGLARVTASEFGRPAAGVAEARELLARVA